MKKIILVLSGLSFSSLSFAAYIQAANTTITRVFTYGSGSVTGDIVFQMSNPVAGCENGYYITEGNSGKEEILSIALSAFHAGAKVSINAYDAPRWP